ncbi:MAG: ComEC/Rec2 family competence protein, partial [Tabrizicola sp.]
QMSFAATIALIVGFSALDDSIYRQKLPRWLMPLFTLVLSSLIGGLATAPYAAAHFNRFTDYGLLANILTVPVMGAVVMPAGALAALMAPFGLAWLPLWVMEQGARWILFVAHWIAGLDGAVTAIPTPDPRVLPLFTLGALWLILWRGRGQAAGLIPVLVALALWVTTERPLLLVSGDGRLVGLAGEEGRALSASRGGGFSAENWLQNDGDLAGQEEAAGRPGFTGPKDTRWFDLAGLRAVALTGKGSEDRLAGVCAQADLVILAGEAETRPEACPLVDRNVLRQTGPLAVWNRDGNLTFETTTGDRRLWSPRTRAVDLPDLRPRSLALAGQ